VLAGVSGTEPWGQIGPAERLSAVRLGMVMWQRTRGKEAIYSRACMRAKQSYAAASTWCGAGIMACARADVLQQHRGGQW
jgi:hypothetical protein